MKWRVVFTDTESPTGVGPVCDLAPMTHGVDYVNDCCPGPQIECRGEEMAKATAEALTLIDAEWCT